MDWNITVEDLLKFDGVNWTVYNTSNSGLPYNELVNAIAVDGQGNKWIGTWMVEGLQSLMELIGQFITHSNSGLPDNYVYAIAIDGQGNKWIGTNGGGLAKFDGVNWTVYNTSNSGVYLLTVSARYPLMDKGINGLEYIGYGSCKV
jgi:ligand-binding sensor domain-containing protein